MLGLPYTLDVAYPKYMASITFSEKIYLSILSDTGYMTNY